MARRDRMRVFSVSFPPELLRDLDRAAEGRPGGRSETLRAAFLHLRNTEGPHESPDGRLRLAVALRLHEAPQAFPDAITLPAHRALVHSALHQRTPDGSTLGLLWVEGPTAQAERLVASLRGAPGVEWLGVLGVPPPPQAPGNGPPRL